MNCNNPHWQNALAEALASNQTDLPPALAKHLAECPFCQAEVRWLREVEAALAAWPLAEPDPGFLERLLGRLAREEMPSRAWQVLPWNIWVPVVAVGAALVISALALPPQIPQQWEPAIAEWPRQVIPWAAEGRLTLDKGLFWAFWSGLFVAAGGVGLTLALNAWGSRQARRVEEFKRALNEAADHLLKMAHHTS